MEAGIIAGSVAVRSHFDERPVEKGSSGYVSLYVPVKAKISYSSNQVWHVGRPDYPNTSEAEKTTLVVAHLISKEMDNRTTDPQNDFGRLISREAVLIGREEIYEDSRFHLGIGTVLLALEQEVTLTV